jgi:hypothetical protein
MRLIFRQQERKFSNGSLIRMNFQTNKVKVVRHEKLVLIGKVRFQFTIELMKQEKTHYAIKTRKFSRQPSILGEGEFVEIINDKIRFATSSLICVRLWKKRGKT